MKQKKRTLNVFHYLLLCLLFLCFSIPGEIFAGDKPVIKLSYGSYAPKASIDDPAMWFLDEVSKRSGVEIKLTTNFSSTLAKAPDCLNAIGAGVYDIGWISPAYTPGKIPYSMMMGSTPLVARSLYSVLAAADEVSQTFKPAKAEYENAKVKFLFNTGVWHYDYIGTKPIKSLGDIKNKKVRTYGYFSKAWSAFNGIPVAMSIMESYDGLQKGMIDGVLIQARFMDKGLRLTEVAKYYTKLDFGCLPAPVIMNLKTWNKLPESVKKAMLEVAKEMPGKGSQVISSSEFAAIDDMKKKGIIFNELSVADQAKVIKLGSVISDQLVADLDKRGVKNIREAMDIYLKALDKYFTQENQ